VNVDAAHLRVLGGLRLLHRRRAREGQSGLKMWIFLRRWKSRGECGSSNHATTTGEMSRTLRFWIWVRTPVPPGEGAPPLEETFRQTNSTVSNAGVHYEKISSRSPQLPKAIFKSSDWMDGGQCVWDMPSERKQKAPAILRAPGHIL
jgi:hypothetical protein